MIKVCGITRPEDARTAVAHGATALGFICWPNSPRYVTPEQLATLTAEIPAVVARIGVFVNEDPARVREIVGLAGLTAVQLHGDETPDVAAAMPVSVIRSATLGDITARRAQWPPQTILLLDAADPVRRGGTGRPVDWEAAARVAATTRIILAGGLNPDNVAEAIARVQPHGVDVSSGVEAMPGVKDAEKLERFLTRAREAFAAVRARQADTIRRSMASATGTREG